MLRIRDVGLLKNPVLVHLHQKISDVLLKRQLRRLLPLLGMLHRLQIGLGKPY
jgi:hypothetical protein